MHITINKLFFHRTVLNEFVEAILILKKVAKNQEKPIVESSIKQSNIDILKTISVSCVNYT